MWLSLPVETDTINVPPCMDRLAVAIDSIELTQRIDLGCDNGFSLHITDGPGRWIT